MLLMVERGIRGEMSHSIYQYGKANTKNMKDYDKIIVIYSILGSKQFLWLGMSQKLPVNNFKGVKDTPQFIEDFIKNYNKQSDERYFLEADVQYPEKFQ